MTNTPFPRLWQTNEFSFSILLLKLSNIRTKLLIKADQTHSVYKTQFLFAIKI